MQAPAAGSLPAPPAARDDRQLARYHIAHYQMARNNRRASRLWNRHGGKLYTCAVEGCGKPFGTRSHRRIHERFHREEKPWICTEPDCAKAFHQRSDMLRHVLTHQNNKPHVCPVEDCHKRFANKHYLQIHQLWHDNLTPYCCPIPRCGRRFRARYYIQRHLKTHTRQKFWACPVTGCGQHFAQRGSLHRHWYLHGAQARYSSCTGMAQPAAGTPGSAPGFLPADAGWRPPLPVPEHTSPYTSPHTGPHTGTGPGQGVPFFPGSPPLVPMTQILPPAWPLYLSGAGTEFPGPGFTSLATPLPTSWPPAAAPRMEPAGPGQAMTPGSGDRLAAQGAPAARPVAQAAWPAAGYWQEPGWIQDPAAARQSAGQPAAPVWYEPDGHPWYSLQWQPQATAPPCSASGAITQDRP